MHKRVSRARWRAGAMLAALAIVAVACGARVDGEQVKALGTQSSGTQSAAGDTASPTGPGDASGTGATGGPVTTTATGGAGGGTSTGAAGSAATASGDNGGAVDTGVTATSVLLGNVATLSGPVPGLFEGAVVGAQAAVAYQNSLGGLFGRKFKLDVRDDQLDTGQNRSQTIDLIHKAFAMMGSFSLYDDAAVPELQASGMPDTSYALSATRRNMPDNFSVAPAKDGGAPTTEFLWFKQHYPDAVTKVGSIYGDVAASKASHMAYQAAAESVGWHWVYERGTQATETDFTADVIRMKQAGVKLVWEVSEDDKTDARLIKAMQAQNFKPDVIRVNYYPTIANLAGAAAEGAFAVSPQALFDGADTGTVPEVKLMNDWIQKVKPGYKTDLFAAYSWAEGRLLFQAMQAAGPKAKRADVLAALRAIQSFNANNLVAPANPAGKVPPVCVVIAQMKGGHFQRVDPAGGGFICNGTYHQ